MDLKTVIYEKKDRIAYITLNRPETLNSLNSVMRHELPQVWQDIKDDDNIWVVVFTGAGDKAFCSGADVKEMAEHGIDAGLPKVGRPITARNNGIFKPVICAVNGMCAGAGLLFVAHSDILICSENATFFDTHVNVGQVPAIEPIILSRRIPLGIVLRMFAMGLKDRMSAQRAYEVGLVSEVVPLQRLMPRATEIAETVLEGAPLALRSSLEAIWGGLELPLRDACAQGYYLLRENWHTEDWKEGPRAFAEKRKPQWKQR